MLCKKCGKEIAEGTTVCPECGEALTAADKAPVQAEYNPFSGPPIDTPTSQLNYAALKQHYKQAAKRPPRNVFFWAAKILMTAAMVCFFLPFITGSLNLFDMSGDEKYSGFDFMVEAKDYIMKDSGTAVSDDGGIAGAWVTLIALSLGFVFMLGAVALRRGYGTLALGTLVIYVMFFIIVSMVGNDESLNHTVKIRPGVGLIVCMILLVVVIALSVADSMKARAELRKRLGIV